MTKQDRAAFDFLLTQIDHYRRMAIVQCLNYGLTSKRAELAKLRAEFGITG